MKLLTTIHNLDNLRDLAVTADGFILGNEQFGTRLTTSYSLEQINSALTTINNLGREAFILLNQLYTNDHINTLEEFIGKLDTTKITGFICGDLGVIMLLKKMNLSAKAVYNPETLLTNYYDFNYLSEEGIYGAYVAKEITLDDVILICQNKKYHTFMVGHGHLNMFYSKRQLLKNYTDYLAVKTQYHNDYNLKIVEEKRADSPYPLLEDYAGTHVFRSNVFSSLNYLDKLTDKLDYLVIDTIFKDDRYGKKVLMLYRGKSTDQIALIKQLKDEYNETWDEGFINTKTMYKR